MIVVTAPTGHIGSQFLADLMDIAKEHGLDNALTRTPENTTPTSFRQWAQEVLKPALDAE
jgi:hypothetical protein